MGVDRDIFMARKFGEYDWNESPGSYGISSIIHHLVKGRLKSSV